MHFNLYNIKGYTFSKQNSKFLNFKRSIFENGPFLSSKIDQVQTFIQAENHTLNFIFYNLKSSIFLVF